MIAAMIIVFREVLEAALIVGIVLAATRGLPRAKAWVSGGITCGLIGACVIAASAGAIASALSGFGQEIFNAAVLGIAVTMLAWHNVWMKRHGREMAQDMSRMGRKISDGGAPLYMLAVVVGVAVLREGAETVLFLYGLTLSEPGQLAQMLLGAAGGVLSGAAMGACLYFGLARMSQRHLFSVTSWMITLLAAGMAAQALGWLNAAGVMPDLGPELWDSAWLLPEGSVLGKILHALIGYMDRPTAYQALAYGTVVLVIAGGTRLFGQAPSQNRAPAGAALPGGAN